MVGQVGDEKGSVSEGAEMRGAYGRRLGNEIGGEAARLEGEKKGRDSLVFSDSASNNDAEPETTH